MGVRMCVRLDSSNSVLAVLEYVYLAAFKATHRPPRQTHILKVLPGDSSASLNTFETPGAL